MRKDSDQNGSHAAESGGRWENRDSGLYSPQDAEREYAQYISNSTLKQKEKEGAGEAEKEKPR